MTLADDGRDRYVAGGLLRDSWSTALGAGLVGLDYRVLGAVTSILAPYGWVGERIGGTQLAALVYDLEAPAPSHRSKITASLRRLDEAGAISWIPGRGGARGWVILAPLDTAARAGVEARARAHIQARELGLSRPPAVELAPAGGMARARPSGHSIERLTGETYARGAHPSPNGARTDTETDTDYDEAEVERYAARIRSREAR